MKRIFELIFILFLFIILSCSQYDMWHNGTNPIDILPPEIDAVRAESNTVITVDFAEEVEVISAETAANYNIAGLDVISAVRSDTNFSIVILQTASQDNIDYILEITDVIDKFRNEVLEPIEVSFIGDALPITGITSPSDGSFVRGEVTIAASASDSADDEITSVKIYIDTENIEEIPAEEFTSVPYNYSWDTASLADGSAHTIMSAAVDTAGNITVSNTITVTIDNQKPTVAFTNPAANSTVSNAVTITAAPSDAISIIAYVDFLIDGTYVSRVYTLPYEYGWNTTAAANNNHTITLRACDIAGNISDDNEITVTVDNEIPTVAFNPLLNTYVSGTVAITAEPQDTISGVQSVDFLIEGTIVFTDDSAPYEYSWDTSAVTDGTSYKVSLVAHDNIGNNSNSNDATVTVDNTAPSVTIISPVGGSFSDSTITITADATDGTSGIAYVDFYVIDNTSFTYYLGRDDTDDTAPYYTWDWDRTGYDLGLTYTIRAEAFDKAGNSALNNVFSINLL